MLLVHLLAAGLHGEEREHIFRGHRLLGLGIQHGHGLVGHVRLDVVPLCGYLLFAEEEAFLLAHIIIVCLYLGFVMFS